MSSQLVWAEKLSQEFDFPEDYVVAEWTGEFSRIVELRKVDEEKKNE